MRLWNFIRRAVRTVQDLSRRRMCGEIDIHNKISYHGPLVHHAEVRLHLHYKCDWLGMLECLWDGGRKNARKF
jgi:hypothetical protein